MGMSKKWILATTLIGMPLLAAGCAGDDEAEGTGEEREVDLSFMHWRGEDQAVFDVLIDQFESENPDINVEQNVYPSDQYMATAQRMLQEGSTGDVFATFPGAQFEALESAGFFEDLSDEEFVANFDEGAIEVGQADGRQLALPYQLVFNMPVYNTEIFEELGLEVPQSWDEFIAMGETLKENDIIPIAFPGADIGPNQFMNSMVMNNAPDGAFTDLVAGEAALTDDWWIQTLEQFQYLQENDFFQEDALGTNQDAAMALVANGEAAMLATGSYHMASLLELNPDLQLDLLAPITVSEEEARYEGIHTATFMLAINSNSENKEAAAEFIEFLSQPEVASQYANETGQHLTVTGVEYESEALQNTSYWIDERETRFQPRYMITNAQVEDAVLSSIENVIGGAAPEEAAAEAQQVVEEVTE
ncbi:ABC transporter substrate-binding protein [Planococcus lenghuensis]|uniref:ABC transporter substrate-binding protein n=2 Tax=Planococcus lenghuensis TaxID=2213202 RepID=A0A1Q2KUS9_9BACL|nr:ABC transporter substrate-binding protein [Planococcus lenghuensis]